MNDKRLLELIGKALALGYLGFTDKQIQAKLNLTDSQMEELLSNI